MYFFNDMVKYFLSKIFSNPSHSQEGVVIPAFAMWLVVIIGMMGLVLDHASSTLRRIELQQAMDASTMSYAFLKIKDTPPADTQLFFEDNIRHYLQNFDTSDLTILPITSDGYRTKVEAEWSNNFRFIYALLGYNGNGLSARSEVGIPSVNLSIVADLSGSMAPTGSVTTNPRLRMIQQIDSISKRLRETTDRLSLVTHKDWVELTVPFEAAPAFDRSNFDYLTMTATYLAGNHTSLGEGLWMATEQFKTIPSTPTTINAILMMGDGQMGIMDPLVLDPAALPVDPVTTLPLLEPSSSSRGTHVYRLFTNGNCGGNESDPTPILPAAGNPRIQWFELGAVSETTSSLNHWSSPLLIPASCGSKVWDSTIPGFTGGFIPGSAGFSLHGFNGTDCNSMLVDTWPDLFNSPAYVPDTPDRRCLTELKILHPDPALTATVDIPAWPTIDKQTIPASKKVQILLQSDYARSLGINTFYVIYENTPNSFIRRLALDEDSASDPVSDLDDCYDLGRVPLPGPLIADPNIPSGAVIAADDSTSLFKSIGSVMWRLQVRWLE